MGCYLALDDASNIEDIVIAIGHCPRGEALLVDSNFNEYLSATEGHIQDE